MLNNNNNIIIMFMLIGMTLVVQAQNKAAADSVKTANGTPDTFRVFMVEHELEGVVITGTRTEKRLSESPILTRLISDKDIKIAAAVSTIETLQDHIPGIVVFQNAMGNNLRIKGLNSYYILFLVDGERLVSEGAGGKVNLDQIDVNIIKRIEVVEGASSALYGSNAVGAVINIITKEPVHTVELGANQIWENHNTWRTKVDLGSSIKNFSARASFSRNSSDGFGGKEDGVYAARFEDYGANLKLQYKPISLADMIVSCRYFQHETFNPENSMNVKHSQTKNITLGVNGGFTTKNDKNSLRLNVNFDKYFDYDILEKKDDERKLKNTVSYFSIRAVNTFIPTKKWEAVGGIEYNHEENYAVTTLGVEPASKRLDDLNFFVQAQYKILKKIDIVGGARYTHNSQFRHAFTPKLSLMYGIAGFKFRGGISTAFRAPSIKELYYDFDHQGMFWIYGNPELKPEKGIYFSLSAEYTHKIFNISVSSYLNRINNKITQYDVITSERKNEKYYKNVNGATLAGFELNIVYTLIKQIVLKGSYSFCDAKDNATELQLTDNVKHSATISITWNGAVKKSPFSIQFAGRINSPILYHEIAAVADGNQEAVKIRSKSYHIWKITLIKPFTIKKQHILELTFKVDNLFNFKDAYFINSGRSFLVGVHYNFNFKKKII